MASVLVVGSAGQLGSELMRAAWPEGWRVVGVDRADVDICDPDAVSRAIEARRPELIVNASAYTAVDRAEQEPELARAVNALGPGYLASHGLPLIHVSTDYVFEGSKPEPYVESDPIGPLGVYGATKAEGEQRVRDALAEHVIVRTSWVFGAFGANFVKTMLRLGESRDVVSVVDDQVGGPTPAAAIAAALVEIARRIDERSAAFGTYHFAGTPPTSWHGFARAIFEAWRDRGGRVPELRAIASSEYPTPAKRPASSVLDSSALERSYGIAPPDWRSGLCAVLDEIMTVRARDAGPAD